MNQPLHAPAAPALPFAAFAPRPSDQGPLREAITAAYRTPEPEALAPLLEQAQLSPRLDAAAQATAAVGHPAAPPTAAPAATTESIPATEPPPEAVAPTAVAPTEPSTESEPGNTGETIHVVQPGENLYQIGLLYGLTWQAIAEYNGITNPDAIDVGQELKIPGN